MPLPKNATRGGRGVKDTILTITGIISHIVTDAPTPTPRAALLAPIFSLPKPQYQRQSAQARCQGTKSTESSPAPLRRPINPRGSRSPPSSSSGAPVRGMTLLHVCRFRCPSPSASSQAEESEDPVRQATEAEEGAEEEEQCNSQKDTYDDTCDCTPG